MPNIVSYILIIIGAILMLFPRIFFPSKSKFQGAGRFPVRGEESPSTPKGVHVVRVIGIVLLFAGVFLFIRG